jgi:glycosyltransferase involved in cell wall biosynthesis
LSRSPDIALISPYPRLGSRHGGHSGVASYTSNLAHALADEGAAVTVVAPEVEGEPTSGSDGPVAVRRCFRPGPGALPTAMRAALASGAPTVHLQHEVFLYGGAGSIPSLGPALAAAHRIGGAVVTMHHVVAPAEVDAEFMRLHRVGAPVAVTRAGLAAVNEAVRVLARTVIVHEPQFAERLPGAAVVPHGIERVTTPDRDASRQRLGIADGRFVALSFGFLAPYKGIEQALKAAALAGGEVELVVAGGEHPRLAEREPYGQALRTRLPDAARFVGRVPEEDVGAWFAAADLALFMYPRPFAASGALALAHAHGTPPLLSEALGTAIGAPSELTVDSHPIALADRLRELAAERRQLALLRRAAAGLAAGRSWPEIARRHLQLYAGEHRPDRDDRSTDPKEVSTNGRGSAGRLVRAA